MLAIKLKPVGRKHQISYRVVVAEKRSKLKGKYIEDIGWVNPHEGKFHVDKERARYWVETGGAQPTDSVYNLLVQASIIEGKKRPVHSKKKISEEDMKEEEEKEAPETKEEEVEKGEEEEQEESESEEEESKKEENEESQEEVRDKEEIKEELEEETEGESSEENEKKEE